MFVWNSIPDMILYLGLHLTNTAASVSSRRQGVKLVASHVPSFLPTHYLRMLLSGLHHHAMTNHGAQDCVSCKRTDAAMPPSPPLTAQRYLFGPFLSLSYFLLRPLWGWWVRLRCCTNWTAVERTCSAFTCPTNYCGQYIIKMLFPLGQVELQGCQEVIHRRFFFQYHYHYYVLNWARVALHSCSSRLICFKWHSCFLSCAIPSSRGWLGFLGIVK